MKHTFVFVILIFLGFNTQIHAQNMEFYQPVGFNNPLLKSGQFITTLYYYNTSSKYVRDLDEYKNILKSFSFASFLGITDAITLNVKLSLYPEQTIFERIVVSGTDQQNFNIKPEFVLSYRPIGNMEIFGSVLYNKNTTVFGEQTLLALVPFIDPQTGEVIYQTSEVTYGGAPDLTFSNTTFTIGISYNGQLW
jgi:hypothetical protein